jgi:hypothetical protein
LIDTEASDAVGSSDGEDCTCNYGLGRHVCLPLCNRANAELLSQRRVLDLTYSQAPLLRGAQVPLLAQVDIVLQSTEAPDSFKTASSKKLVIVSSDTCPACEREQQKWLNLVNGHAVVEASQSLTSPNQRMNDVGDN